MSTTNTNSNGGKATLTVTNPMKVPTLSAGDIDIETCLNWVHACDEYFLLKDVPADKQVIHAMTGLQGLLMKDWFRADVKRMSALTWDVFVAEFKREWLPAKWEIDTRNALINYRQKYAEPFKSWIIKAETLNACLANTASHKNEATFRELVEANLCSCLQELALMSPTFP